MKTHLIFYSLLRRGADIMQIGFKPHAFMPFDKPILNTSFGMSYLQDGEWVDISTLNINDVINFKPF